MVRTNLDGRTHIHRTKIVTTMSHLPASGLDKNYVTYGQMYFISHHYNIIHVCVLSQVQECENFMFALKFSLAQHLE